jgi:hypothetical protein
MKFFSKNYEIPRATAARVLCASFVPVKFTVAEIPFLNIKQPLLVQQLTPVLVRVPNVPAFLAKALATPGPTFDRQPPCRHAQLRTGPAAAGAARGRRSPAVPMVRGTPCTRSSPAAYCGSESPLRGHGSHGRVLRRTCRGPRVRYPAAEPTRPEFTAL